MAARHVWTRSIMTSTGIFGLTITSVLAFVAHSFVKEFSRPHMLLPDSAFDWGLPLSEGTEPPLKLQRSLLFQTADGTLLRGDFWAQPQLAPTIVLCHGYRTSRTSMRAAVALEYAYGYNVLFFDFRGHGDSDSVMTSAGNAEVRDLQAAIFVAARQPETLPGKIIIHGFSMGAAVALLTPPHPDVSAIIADSPYARSDDILRRLIAFRLVEGWSQKVRWMHPPLNMLSLVAWHIVLMSTVVFRVRFGFSVVARPDTSFKRWKAQSQRTTAHQVIPILLIHSAGDTLIPIQHARQILAAAKAQNVPLETYFAEASEHCGAYGWNPQQYNSVLQHFLARHLQDALPAQHRSSAV